MKRVFFKRTLGAVVAAVTITTLSPLGISAAVKQPINNLSQLNQTNCIWYYIDSNGKIQIGNPKIKDRFVYNKNFDWLNCIANITDSNTANLAVNPNNVINENNPGINGSSNGAGNIVTPEKPGINGDGAGNIVTPEKPGINGDGTENIVTPEKPGINGDGTGNVVTPNKPETNQSSNGTGNTVTTPNKSENQDTTTTNTTTVNINGLATLPQKYTISIQSSAENKILELMNQKRVAAGLKPLSMDNTLLQVARYKSNHMIQYNYFDHINPDGTKWTNWLQAIGYKYTATAENIAYNTYDPVELFNQWWNSEGHRKNMMSPSYTKVGVGVIYAKDNKKYMGTQTFSN
ncbi:CAP domain-containing protein [Clostridium weizhouense]|uniref:CAP domain-containing protein n=1 Tax=Clostridium weizhouense TaxID=2859781 RepID=A0ABS7APT2_9CLOT|nr:CAP domain-containing protein [Clostridium weizhouense]MBW6410554.1 CAP domain-containing protein [Clostridium weizhouense]